MRTILFIILTQLLAVPAMAKCIDKWDEPLASKMQDKDNDIFYLSKCNLKANGDNRIFLFMVNFKHPSSVGYKSMLLNAEYDCKKRRLRPLYSKAFAEPFGKGKILNKTNLDGFKNNKWFEVDENSPGIKSYTKFCSVNSNDLPNITPAEYLRFIGRRAAKLGNDI